MDHAALIAELPDVEKLPVLKRLELAKKRRAVQLTKWHERDERVNASEKRKRGRRLKFKASIALLEATFRGDFDEVKLLLEAGADPNSRNEDGLTPLHQCCIDDNVDLLLLFIRSGADVNSRDTEMWTPLHAAACCGHLGIAKVLVQNGADLLAVNADTNMPYDICDDDATLEYLESEMAQRGVTQEQIDYLRGTTERTMLADMKQIHNSGGIPDFLEYCGATPLHIAAANGYLSVAQFLLDCGVPVDRRDIDYWQPIHAAACWAQPHVIELLVSYGADINATTNNGETPLDLCEESEVREVILELIREQEDHMERQHFVRESYRLSKRRKPISKFESPQFTNVQNVEAHSSSSSGRAIRRLSLRDKTGSTLARLEARQEALIRTQSLDESDFSPIIVSSDPSQSKSDSVFRRSSEPSVTQAPKLPRKDFPPEPVKPPVSKVKLSRSELAVVGPKLNGNAIIPPPSYKEAEKLISEGKGQNSSPALNAPSQPEPKDNKEPITEVQTMPSKPVSARLRAPPAPRVPPRPQPPQSRVLESRGVATGPVSSQAEGARGSANDEPMTKPPEALNRPKQHQEWYLITSGASSDTNGTPGKQRPDTGHHAVLQEQPRKNNTASALQTGNTDLQYQRLVEPHNGRASAPSLRSTFGCCSII